MDLLPDIYGGKYIPGIPGACATRDFTYLVRGPLHVGSENQKLPF